MHTFALHLVMVRPRECNIRLGSALRFRAHVRVPPFGCIAPGKDAKPMPQTAGDKFKNEEIANALLTNPLNHTETLHIATSGWTVNGYSMKEDRTQPGVSIASHALACRCGQLTPREEKIICVAPDHPDAPETFWPDISYRMLQKTTVSFEHKQ
ncbi:hypothetical protein shim_26890 [Shimia sp. SK013]|nr:hypothetical protein shim_26890 [Shimia sp. SK013]